MAGAIGGDYGESATEWNAIKADGLTKGELGTFLGGKTVTKLDYTGSVATGDSWTFTVDNVDFTLSSDGTLSFKNQFGSPQDVIAGSAEVKVTDGLTAEEAAAFSRVFSSSTNPTSGNGRTTGFQFQPKTMFQKMLYGISKQMNDMFMDILSMSTVLSNGTGLRGILLLADKGITIDGVSIANMIKGPNGEPIDDLMALGAMFEGNPSISSITGPGGASLGDGGEVTAVDINMPDGRVSFNFADSNGLSLVVSPPPEGQPWSINNVDVKLANYESILESPGTLFLIQQLLQQMKDAMQAIGAVGKVGGDVKTTAIQSFVRDMNG
ncbi:MAG: hypothetical protein WCH76_00335 [Candidatus Riflemargulisbacteria bacterium]